MAKNSDHYKQIRYDNRNIQHDHSMKNEFSMWDHRNIQFLLHDIQTKIKWSHCGILRKIT